jgi:TRAP-type C4-dicarboxylate transport system substrate-binding protein
MFKPTKFSGVITVALSLMLLIAIVTGCTGTKTETPATAVKPIKLVFSEFEPAGSYWETEVARPYFAEIEKRTNGKVQIEQHYSGELAGLFDVYDAVLKGTIDIAKILPTMFADKFPMDGIMIFQPVNIKTYRAGQVWLDLYNEFSEMQAQYKDTPLLGFAPMPCSGLYTTGKEIYKWEDCQGLKAPGAGPAPESRQKAVGIVPMSIAPPDTYMGFKTGTLDCIAAAIQSLEDFGWADVLPTCTMVNINGGPWSYVMSKKAWDSLPADVQQVFKDMIPNLTSINDKLQYTLEQNALSTFPQKYGTKFITLSQAELDRWAAVDTPSMDAYLAEWVTGKGLPGDKLKSEFLRLHKKYAASEYAFK